MTGSGWGLATRIVAAGVACLFFETAGCAPGSSFPRGAPDPRGPRDQPIAEEIPRPTLELLEGTIVDLHPSEGRVTLKDNRTYHTWTIVVTGDTRIMSDDTVIGPGDLPVGGRVRIRGTTRIKEILRALEINVLDESANPQSR